MTKASSVYVIMLLVFGAGLWAILSIGSLREAPEDLSGTWALWPANSAPEEGDMPEQTLAIEQSGRFFNIAFQDHRLDMKLVEHTSAGPIEGERQVKIANDQWTLIGRGMPGGNEMILELSGPVRQTWRAVRTWRKYPDQSKPSPTIPHPTTSHALE